MAVAVSARTSPELEALSPKNFRRLAELIQGYSGIKMPPSKRTMLEGRLRRRMRAVGLSSLNAYCDFLFEEDGLDSELGALIDAVTTNKTEFFREPAHFTFLRERGLAALLQGRGPLKAWSAACSSGAEPYTLAMVIEEHARETGRRIDYSVLCTDLCSEVLQAACAGVYSSAMIAPVPPQLRKQFVMRARDAQSDLVRIAPELRSKLAFGRLNLMDEAYPVDADMDLIFCRNILIYFDKPTQAKVLGRLCDHLRPGGYLFLGHSESMAGIDIPVRPVANTVFQRV